MVMIKLLLGDSVASLADLTMRRRGEDAISEWPVQLNTNIHSTVTRLHPSIPRTVIYSLLSLLNPTVHLLPSSSCPSCDRPWTCCRRRHDAQRMLQRVLERQNVRSGNWKKP
jgi:hypothetical protein